MEERLSVLQTVKLYRECQVSFVSSLYFAAFGVPSIKFGFKITAKHVSVLLNEKKKKKKSSFKSNENNHKEENVSYYVVSAGKMRLILDTLNNTK